MPVFDDVFEAMRYLEKGNPVINLKDKRHGYLKRNFHFNLLQMPNGKIGAFPLNMSFRFFRGENDDYDLKYPCVPSIYRAKQEEKDAEGNRNAERILIDNLKVAEFELVVKGVPQVKYAIKDYCDVDYRALAQHYELKTDLLDVTSDIAVAAFFATHFYDSEANDYRVKENGVGCIRLYLNVMTESNPEPFRMIGLQPFQRPGLQSAFAVKMGKGENFSNFSTKFLFEQNAKWNRKLREAFYPHGRNILFPSEEICDVADLIKCSKSVSTMAVQKYCEEIDCTREEVETVLIKNNIKIIDRLPYSLTRQQRRNLERKYKGRPYGDVKLHFRACYTPPG